MSDDYGVGIQNRVNYNWGSGSVVAVVDTGVNPHRELDGRILPGFDFVSDPAISSDGDGRDRDASDPGVSGQDSQCRGDDGTLSPASWHGTYVSGIVGAKSDGSGISGVSPAVDILPVRASGNCVANNADVADGIVWASGGSVIGVPRNDHPADVITVSLSEVSECDTDISAAIRTAEGNGSSVVLSAGNEGVDASLSNPSNCGLGISVGASDKNGKAAYYSNWGNVVDVWAPGGDARRIVQEGVLSSIDLGGESWLGEDGYGYYQGSSAAAPHVAGIIAGMKGFGFRGTDGEIVRILNDCSRKVGTETSRRSVDVLDGGCAIDAAIRGGDV
ncbi:S8 family serine peptidase [Corynebacterium variabile]|uniref:S8 family serine peptidase n=1 Tax=Corynebacterium variabile TaxID=1727 RepID=UPI003FD12AE6